MDSRLLAQIGLQWPQFLDKAKLMQTCSWFREKKADSQQRIQAHSGVGLRGLLSRVEVAGGSDNRSVGWTRFPPRCKSKNLSFSNTRERRVIRSESKSDWRACRLRDTGHRSLKTKESSECLQHEEWMSPPPYCLSEHLESCPPSTSLRSEGGFVPQRNVPWNKSYWHK